MYKETYKVDGIRVRKAVIQDIDKEPRTDKKSFIRKEIEEHVFDLEDSVADNAKMISLLTSLISRMWKIMPEEQKQNLSEQDRNVIDNVITAFDNTITWADIKWEVEGEGFADKLIKRQGKIGEIIKKVYGV